MRTMIKKSPVKKSLKKAGLTRFKPLVLSRHPSHRPLRTLLALNPFRAVVRLGSETVLEDDSRRVQINTPNGVRNSASKLRMKQCFDRAQVKHAPWHPGRGTAQDVINWANRVGYPIISKSHHGSRGNGNTKHNDQASLERFVRNNPDGYIYEKFVPYSREYRLHVTNNGCFYTCRKLVRNDAPQDTWQRHDDVCVWVVEENPSFKKPANWNAIVQDCIRAKNALGLDICAFDVLVQGSTEGRERTNPEWLICESCSAASHGTITSERYITEINKLVLQKYNAR